MFKSLNLLIEGLVNATVEAVNEAVVMHDTQRKKNQRLRLKRLTGVGVRDYFVFFPRVRDCFDNEVHIRDQNDCFPVKSSQSLTFLCYIINYEYN